MGKYSSHDFTIRDLKDYPSPPFFLHLDTFKKRQNFYYRSRRGIIFQSSPSISSANSTAGLESMWRTQRTGESKVPPAEPHGFFSSGNGLMNCLQGSFLVKKLLLRRSFLCGIPLRFSWYDLGLPPCPVTETTRIITFLVGDPYKPAFATVTERGDTPRYDIFSEAVFSFWCWNRRW